MSVGKMLVEKLRELAASSNANADHTLTVQGEAMQAALEFADADRYSVALRSLTVGGGVVGDDVRGYLSATAAAIARRLSYLEEPLAVWELDSAERVVQLRSSPPQREADEITYWEVVLHAAEQPSASIARYRWTPQLVEREVVVYPATFALVARMSDSLQAALTEADATEMQRGV